MSRAHEASPWDALIRRPAVQPFDRCHEDAAEKFTSKAGQIRSLLRRNGPLSAAAICMDVDIASTGLVGAVLKNDLAIGRICFGDGLYTLSSSYDDGLRRRIGAAIALLKANGYRVGRAK